MSMPLPPATVTATVASGRVFLSWTKAAGATSYNVKRATISGGPYRTIASVPAGSRRTDPILTTVGYMDSGLTNGTTYYYVVTSVHGGVESVPSSEVSATPGAIPSAPASLSATPGDTQISISWSASAGAVSYNVWKSTVHGGPYSLLVSQAGTSYVDTGLTNGVTYYYTVSAVGQAGEGPMADEASATPSGSMLSMTTAHRTSGVAPLGVTFDAVDMVTPLPWTSGVDQPSGGDYAKFSYQWDFGDASSGTWLSDGRSKNKSIGYCASHVYDAPGTYDVTLTIIKDDDTTLVYKQTITVTAFAGTDFYISTTGSDSNDGLSPSTPWQTIGKVFANIATNRRYNFKRGDHFIDSVGGRVISAAGRGLFAAYGSGALPILECTATGGSLGAFITPHANDWSFQDLNIIGTGASDVGGGLSISSDVKVDNILFYRLTMSAWFVAIGNSDVPATYDTPDEGIIIAGCSIDVPHVNGIYLGGYHLGVIGNSVTNSDTSHLVRIWEAVKSAISNNFLDHPEVTRHCIKLHTRPEAGHPQTQYVYVSFNKFRRGGAWIMPIGPENTTFDEPVTDVICDSNDCVANPNGEVQIVFLVVASRVTVRNNWCVADFSKYFAIVDIERYAPVPQADDITVYGNTLYKSDSQSGNQITILGIGSTDVGDVFLRNNLLSTPADPTSTISIGTCPGFVSDHNLRSDDPGFQNPAADNFHLTVGSPAVGAGVQESELRKDYDSVDRPLVAAPDIGAYQL